ncbi:UDP-glycosyltransferase superfamily protein [Tanacetum coccineum]
MSWLDSKPQKSVLYVLLGYLPEVSMAQIAEMLAGLKLSGVNFLWATTGAAPHLFGDFGSNGLAVEWYDQWKVLSHSSVGGFLSHCGWNSTKQSLSLDWKNGQNLKTGSFVTREAIAVALRQFMNLESKLMRNVMINAKRLEGICRESVEEGGRPDKEIDCGHINPLLNLCHLLACRSSHLNLTVVVTEEWLTMIGSDPKPDNVRFATIPNVIPSEINRGTDAIGFFVAAQNNMEAPFEEVLDRMEQPVDFIIADVTLKWILDVANRRNIRVAAYWPMSASMFTMWYHVELLQKHQHIYVDLSGAVILFKYHIAN